MARIIIADDDELFVDIVRGALEARGHAVGALPDGENLRAIVDFKKPDVLILDCSMPGKSGMTALREIRMSRINPSQPVMVVTGRTGSSDEWIAYESGANDYMRKPVDIDRLVAHVEALAQSKPVGSA